MTAAVLERFRGSLAPCKQVEVGNKTKIADNLGRNLGPGVTRETIITARAKWMYPGLYGL